MIFKPINDRVIVRKLEQDSVTAGGLILPDNAKSSSSEGVVVAVGTGRLLENGSRAEMTVKVGQTVLFAKYSGSELKMDGEDYKILVEDEIFAIKESQGV